MEAGSDTAVATGYDPLMAAEPALVASVTQGIAFGERAGQKVRHIGSGFAYEGEHAILMGAFKQMYRNRNRLR